MNRLEAELQRLYLAGAAGHETPGLVGPDGRVRAVVLELVQPATWADLSTVWTAVQADLGLPAPAIAVSGRGGYQLWFSLAQPVEAEAALAFLDGLRARYLAAIAPERIRMAPSLDVAGTSRVRHVDEIPPTQVAAERWSAFLAPDLAPLFADEPWLDHPPGTDAQADLLSRLSSTPPEAFMRALQQLRPAAPAPAQAVSAPAAATSDSPVARPASSNAQEPADFLLAVMRDPSVDLRLRIEAAKALLPPTGTGR